MKVGYRFRLRHRATCFCVPVRLPTSTRAIRRFFRDVVNAVDGATLVASRYNQMLIYGLYQKRFPLSFDRGNIQFPLGDELVNQRAVSYGTYNDGLGRGRIALGQLRCGARNVAISFARSPAARITPSQSSGETQRVVAFPAAAMQKASDDFSYRTYWGSVLSRSVFTGLSLLPVHPAVKKMLRIKKKLFHCLM